MFSSVAIDPAAYYETSPDALHSKKNQPTADQIAAAQKKNPEVVRSIPQQPTSLFFTYNTSLTPPYQVLIDTNFLSHTIQHKLPLLETLMDCLYATATPIITSCVMAELEKLGPKYRLALQVARDERWERLQCDHKGVYADDCIVDRVVKHRVYLVATNDRDLKRRIRKVPGVPIVSVARGKYVVERSVLAGDPNLLCGNAYDCFLLGCRTRRRSESAMLVREYTRHNFAGSLTVERASRRLCWCLENPSYWMPAGPLRHSTSVWSHFIPRSWW